MKEPFKIFADGRILGLGVEGGKKLTQNYVDATLLAALVTQMFPRERERGTPTWFSTTWELYPNRDDKGLVIYAVPLVDLKQIDDIKINSWFRDEDGEEPVRQLLSKQELSTNGHHLKSRESLGRTGYAVRGPSGRIYCVAGMTERANEACAIVLTVRAGEITKEEGQALLRKRRLNKPEIYLALMEQIGPYAERCAQ